jgi:hypothetical protein
VESSLGPNAHPLVAEAIRICVTPTGCSRRGPWIGTGSEPTRLQVVPPSEVWTTSEHGRGLHLPEPRTHAWLVVSQLMDCALKFPGTPAAGDVRKWD